MNSVTFDSWPVPVVERFRDPQVRAAMGVNKMMAARAETTRKAISRTLSEDEGADYVSPWRDPARVRSWMTMTAAADARYTMDLIPSLKDAAVPTRLVWSGAIEPSGGAW